MQVTREQCKQFRSNETINPLTGRKIQRGKITHKRLTKACSTSVTNSSKQKDKYIPPLGPMIFWSYDAETDLQKRRENAYEILDFVRLKYLQLKDTRASISESEINDYIELCKMLHKPLPEDANYIHTLEKELLKVKKTKKIMHDEPKHDVFENLVEIRPSRTFNRTRIAFIYNYYAKIKFNLEYCLKHNKKSEVVIPVNMKDLRTFKRYLDYMIKKKLFTYDDIYKHTFKNENFPEEIEALHKQYLKKFPSP